MHDQAPVSRNVSHRHTPALSVTDSLGRPVRQVAYCRTPAQRTADRQIVLNRYDTNGQQSRQWDPRLSRRLEEDDRVPPSQAQLSSLSGAPLWQESADSGWRLTLFAETGHPVESWDSRDSHWQTEYDALMRPQLVHETIAGQSTRVAERFSYGDADAVAGNRCGRLLRHDDEAGSRLIPGYSLSGQEQGEIRHFLIETDLPDWPDATSDRDTLLEPGDGANTTYVYGPLGERLEQTDALGNSRYSRFNLAGELVSLILRGADGSEHRLLDDTRYNAFGQVETQAAGNGVICHAHYDPADGRLQRLSASRPGHAALQDLLYTCDRVGNVLCIEDLSQPVRHFANQRIDPVSTYGYDSLYRLVEATGREAAGALPGPDLPELTPDPGDTSRLLNYRQHYDYDASGNLLSLRHTGQQTYTRRMAVAHNSNHALPWITDTAPENPRAGFDGNGNLSCLHRGQPLCWNARNQLHGLRLVRREDGEHDEEHYRYGSDGLRIRKVTTRRVAGRMQRREVRYLPGLELRDGLNERLGVINIQAGRFAVRCLLWAAGQPGDLHNPKLCYSLGDHLGSSVLELDGEARLISHEGYYPFGGTAWWAARSALEASYKARRYCGHERDASGLYDYGLRYYAPWLARWINPDPAGDVDGSNLYCMVTNNPISRKDWNGLEALDALDLATSHHDENKVADAIFHLAPRLAKHRKSFSAETAKVMASFNSKKQLNIAAAHSGVYSIEGHPLADGFINFKGSLSPTSLFPGVQLTATKTKPELAQYRVTQTHKRLASQGIGFYDVVDPDLLINGVRNIYEQSGESLNEFVESRIRTHLQTSRYRIPVKAGIPGLHAEVRAFNSMMNLAESMNLTVEIHLEPLVIFTERLGKNARSPAGASFPACFNCNGILPPLLHVLTGRNSTPEVPRDIRHRSATPGFSAPHR